MSYSLATLWYERQRFLPGVLAVAFSALLIAMQVGLLLGLFSITSLPIDTTRADIWIGSPQVESVDLGGPIPAESFLSRVAIQPGVSECEFYIQGFGYWTKPDGGRELCMIVASRLDDSSLGLLEVLRKKYPHLVALLTEPGAILIDKSDRSRLGLSGDTVGQSAKINDQNVRIAGEVAGIRSLAGPYIFTSLQTARGLLKLQPDQATYILARSSNPGPVVTELNDHYDKDLTAMTSADFSFKSRCHWLIKTKAGFALGLAAALGLMVGAVVTSQTLYAATAASMREYAVLRALGVPQWRMAATVMAQSFWIGIVGIGLAVPTAYGLARAAASANVPVSLPPELISATAGITLLTALVSGLMALRSLRLVEPAVLLR
jgi:putative ABC transport system permease protein